jgi:PhzF family phenazine biosynthesis protein
MKKYKFKKIDAFATTKSAGNPAGYIKLAAGEVITPEDMQKIAIELKGFVNEVGFVKQVSEDTFELKYYSSEREVEFCGHSTIAIMYDIVLNSPALMKKEKLYAITNKGKLIVENKISTEDAVYIFAPSPKFKECIIPVDEIAKALRVSVQDINKNYPLSIVNAGLETLIVPVSTLKTILAVNPVLEELKLFCISNCIDIIEIFSDEVSSIDNKFRVRVFAPTFGYLEDPATGSGNSAFGNYLIANHLWNGDALSIEQNNEIEKYNIVKLKTEVNGAGELGIVFGGCAITRIEGDYIIY